MGLCALNSRRLTWTKLFINLKKSFFCILTGVLLNCGMHPIIVTKIIINLLIGSESQRSDKNCYRHFTVFIDPHIKNIIRVIFIFQPCATIRNYRRAKKFFTGLIVLHLIVDARRTNQLRNDYTFSTIDYKSTALCHQREIAHKDVGFLDFSALFIEQPGGHM